MADVTVHREGRVLVVRCAGDLDIAARDALREGLLGIVPRDHELLDDEVLDTVLVDLARVGFLDCTALSVLIQLRTECDQAGVVLILAEPATIVRRLLTTLGMHREFVVADSWEAAVMLTTTRRAAPR